MAPPASASWDNGDYEAFCALAAADPRVFEVFRRSPTYKLVLEHVDMEMGAKYLLHVIQHYPKLLDSVDIFKKNDEVGSAEKVPYPGIGDMAPSTLRYMKVFGDLKAIWDNLSGKHIVEIGIGYGGQANVITSMFDVASYTLIDLPAVIALAKRYLSHFGKIEKFRFYSFCDLPQIIKSDLFISNYALTEIDIPYQDYYYERVLKHAKDGYVTYNDYTPTSHSLDEWLKRIPNAVATEEEPHSRVGNCIIVWKKDRVLRKQA